MEDGDGDNAPPMDAPAMNTEDSDAENNYGTPPDVVAAVEFFNELDGGQTVVFGRNPSIASYVRTIVASEAATSASGAFAAEVAAAVHRAADAVAAAVGAAKGEALDDCFGAGVALCDALLELELGDAGDAAQEAVAAAGEALWAAGGAAKASGVAPRLLPYVLLRSLGEDATGGDVRRALKAQGMVDLIDFGDGSSGTLLGLLARTAAAPAFVKHAHGRSFVGGLLGGACEVLAAATHKTVKAQLPLASPGLALHYGDCYFRAWEHAAKREALEDFEECRLQDLARAALFCRDGRLADRLKLVLDRALHERKGRPGVDGTIERVYAPLLWRHLSCPKAAARKRAVAILAAAFPVVADTAKASKKEAVGLALEDQLERLRCACVDDASPDVRAAACAGAATCVSRYWDALPRGSAGRLVKALASTCARDAASAKVREAAVKGLAELAESPALCGDATRAHAVGDAALAAALKDALPRSLHDTAPRCRLAAANCLAAYAASRGVDAALACVKPKDALARLGAARENPKTTLALAKVLVDAYFPLKRHKDDAEAAPRQVSRAVELVTRDGAAAAALYGRLADVAPVGAVAKLVVMLVVGAAAAAEEDDGAAPASAKKPTKKSRKRRQADEDEDSDDDDDEPPPAELAGGALARAMVRAAALAYGSLDRSALGAGDDASERLAAYLRDGVGPALPGLAGVADAADLRALAAAGADVAGGDERERRLALRDALAAAAADSEDAVLDVAARVCAADVDGDGVAKCLGEPLFALGAEPPSPASPAEAPGPRKRGRPPPAPKPAGLPAAAALAAVAEILAGGDAAAQRCRAKLFASERALDSLHAAVKYARAAALAGHAGATLDGVALVETEAALAVAKFERDLDGGFTAADVDERLARDFGALLTGATAHAEAALAEPPAPASPSGGGLFSPTTRPRARAGTPQSSSSSSSSSSSPSAASAGVLGAALAAAGDVLAGAGPALTRALAEAAEAWLALAAAAVAAPARADAALALAPPLLRLAARLRGAGALDASRDAPLLRVLGAALAGDDAGAEAAARATLKVALRDTARRSTLLGALADVAQWAAVADAATPRKARPAGSAGASELLAVVALDEGAALEALACGLDATLLLPHAPPSLAAKIRDAAAPPAAPPAAPALSQAY